MNTVSKPVNRGANFNDSQIKLGSNNQTMGNVGNMGGMNMARDRSNDPYTTEFNQNLRAGVDKYQDVALSDDFFGNILDDKGVKQMMNLYGTAGNNAYNSTLAEGNSYVGAPNSWTAGQAADVKNNYALQFANLIPQLHTNEEE